MEIEIKEIEVQKLELNPGDILSVSIDASNKPDEWAIQFFEELDRELNKIIPEDVSVIIHPPVIEYKILSNENG